MDSTTMCTVTPAIRVGFKWLLGPDHRKSTGPTVMKEMQPGNDTRRHDQMLHLLDVLINQPFRAHIQYSYSEWAQKIHEIMLTGHLKMATLTEMCWWILKALWSVYQALRAKSFKVLASGTRWMGEKMISYSISLMR
jgi:hypothetical protein